MPKTINVLFLAAEADPFIKVGGLGDVAGTLPRELRALSTDELKVDVRLVLPYHAAVKAENLRPVEIFSLPRGDSEVGAETFETSIEGMPVYLINGDPIRASGSVYSFDAKLDTEKYAFFSLAAAELPKHIHWQPDVIHANDWHTALSLYANLTKRWESGSKHVAGVISLHNLPFMGAEAGAALESYGVKLAQTDLPDWARVLPLPLGMWASDAIVAVSPGYANEILAEEFGCGLQGFLSLRRDSLSGILNGIDAVSFDPATDKALGVNYDLERLKLRAENKELLQGKLGLARNPHIPLLGIVSRMDVQKGVDLAFSALSQFPGGHPRHGRPETRRVRARIAESVPRKNQSRNPFRREPGAPDLRRGGYTPDAFALRAVRSFADDRDAVRMRPRRARGGRLERYGRSERDRFCFREGASHVADGRDQIGDQDARRSGEMVRASTQRHEPRFFVEGFGEKIPRTL